MRAAVHFPSEPDSRGLETPVLFIVWNRPEETAKSFAAIRAARPSHLFIAADGPRTPAESRLTDAVRAIATQSIDWPCEVETRFSDSNLGCRAGVTQAIDWFFSHVKAGIILEDDCVAHPEFFMFCEEMLHRYENDPRVLHVAGDNTAGVRIAQNWSYCFIRYPHIWGWATWRRAWDLYDRDLAQWDVIRRHGAAEDLFDTEEQAYRWIPVFDRLHAIGQPDTWDWQWAATCFMHGGLAVQPVTNLISNVGFNERATHTSRDSERADAIASAILPLHHPPFVHHHRSAERQVFERTQRSRKRRSKQRITNWGKTLLFLKSRLPR